MVSHGESEPTEKLADDAPAEIATVCAEGAGPPPVYRNCRLFCESPKAGEPPVVAEGLYATTSPLTYVEYRMPHETTNWLESPPSPPPSVPIWSPVAALSTSNPPVVDTKTSPGVNVTGPSTAAAAG